MNNIESMSLIIEQFFPFILAILIFLSILALRSLWPRFIPSIESFYSFEKGQTEYFEPSRPHSDIFHDYLKLSLMSTGYRQHEFTLLVSNMVKEHIETKSALSNQNYSDSLAHLLLNPNSWLISKLDMIEMSNKKKENLIFEFLFQQYVEIFTELEDLLDINLLPELK
jgi:hypothetical protein